MQRSSKNLPRCQLTTIFTIGWFLITIEGNILPKFQDQLSDKKSINASVVQGSGFGPSSFSVIGSDLKPINENVFMFKFADDMDFVTIMNNYQAVNAELRNVEDWASRNNMTLNMSKTKEIIFRRGRKQVQIPEPHVGIQR